MWRQARGSKYVILQETYASITVRLDDRTPIDMIYRSNLYEGLGWLALRFWRFSERCQVSIRAANLTLQRRPLRAALDQTTFEMVLNNGPRADYGSPTTPPEWAPKVMRPGPKKPAVAGPRTIIQNHTESIPLAAAEYHI